MKRSDVVSRSLPAPLACAVLALCACGADAPVAGGGASSGASTGSATASTSGSASGASGTDAAGGTAAGADAGGAGQGAAGGSVGMATGDASGGAVTPPTGTSGPSATTGGAPADVDAGPAPAPCDPSAGGRTSRPGVYEGYAEARYPDHQRSSFYVEVRDGTRLAMDLFRPVDASGSVVEEPLPVLWMHTPYNRRTFTTGSTAETYPGYALRLVEYGYIVAVVDYRGLYASFGTNLGFNRGEWVEAARMDAYDVTEWLASQPFSSGKVGMWGCSATGGSQMQAATTQPPHLRAIFPMSCEFDVYPFAVPGGMAPEAGDTRTSPGSAGAGARDFTAAAVDGADGRGLLRDALDSHADNVENPGFAPYRDSIAANLQVEWWKQSSPHTYLEALDASGIGMYLAANWDEGATKYGAFFTFNNVARSTKLLIGPAGHCEWSAVREDTGFDLVIEELRFFDHWLKDVDNCVMQEPPVHFYTYNAPEGSRWQSAERWPLPQEQRVPYYFGEGSLSTSAPSGEGGDAQTADRDGELTYTSEPLAEDLQVTGHPVADLWIASTATDGDFVVTLQDVAPDGRVSSYFMEGRLRASHRAIEDPPYDNLGLPWHPFTEAARQPLSPGEPAKLSFDLLPISIVFPAGHRVRVVVRFAEDVTPIPRPAPTVTVFRSAQHPSSITLPVIP